MSKNSFTFKPVFPAVTFDIILQYVQYCLARKFIKN